MAAMRDASSGICGQRKAQISLRIRAAWSILCCPQTESLDTIEFSNGEQTSGWDFAHVQDDVNPLILRMLEGTFSLTQPK